MFFFLLLFFFLIHQQFNMGRNKGGNGKLNPVFRVAGGKAAKAKAKFKAQPVSTNLKKVFFRICNFIFFLKMPCC